MAEAVFFSLSIQFLAVAGLTTWREITSKGATFWPDTFIAIGQTVSSQPSE